METRFKAYIVWLILNSETEKALEMLAEHYEVEKPKLTVGLPKRHKTNVLGCYSARDKTILVLNSDMLKNPSVIIHEFYHHIRIDLDQKHRGNEKNAREFAQDFIEAYKKMIDSSRARGARVYDLYCPVYVGSRAASGRTQNL